MEAISLHRGGSGWLREVPACWPRLLAAWPLCISKLVFGTINSYDFTFYILEGVVVLKGNVVLDTVF